MYILYFFRSIEEVCKVKNNCVKIIQLLCKHYSILGGLRLDFLKAFSFLDFKRLSIAPFEGFVFCEVLELLSSAEAIQPIFQ